MRHFEFSNRSSQARAALQTALDGALAEIGAAAVEHARQALTDSGAVDTGALRDSVRFEALGREVLVGSDLPYAAAIELGDGANRTARPYLTPALMEHGAEYAAMLRERLPEAGR